MQTLFIIVGGIVVFGGLFYGARYLLKQYGSGSRSGKGGGGGGSQPK